ncbi:MAG: LuxR C-terminal-related transcriptional regulator [Dermatophilaceae bacterium]
MTLSESDLRPTDTTRLVIVDDHAIVRHGLRAMLELAPAVEVVAEAGAPAEALAAIADTRPHIVLLDLRLGAETEDEGLALCSAITERFPDVGVPVVTTFLTDRLVTDAIRNGARGYVLKDVDAVQLLRGIAAVRRGESAFDSHAASVVVRSLTRHPESARASLTTRELEVLQLVARGLSNREIGGRLYISETTVKFHIHKVMVKMKVRRRAELVFQAGRMGLL